MVKHAVLSGTEWLLIVADEPYSLYLDQITPEIDGVELTGTGAADIVGGVYISDYWVTSCSPPDGNTDISKKFLRIFKHDDTEHGTL